ncbi:MAG: hypothetical protein NTW25_03620 [Candidatus Kapabacteria bacterium]|nr:hypothetical protein [Candidatus Kapabacteria bacterium]
MKNLKLYIFLICLFNFELNATMPYIPMQVFYLTFNGGSNINLLDEYNFNKQLLGNANINSKSYMNYSYGFGLTYDRTKDNWYKYVIGFDLNFSNKTTIIDGSYTEIKGINLLNDTLNVKNKVSSKFELNYIVFSPYYKYKFENSNYSLLISPQINFNNNSKIINNITLFDTSYSSYLGNPQLPKLKNRLILEQSIIPSEIKDFYLTLLLSFEYQYKFYDGERKDYLGNTKVSFKFDLQFGISPKNNNSLTINPGLTINLFVPIYVNHRIYKSTNDGDDL